MQSQGFTLIELVIALAVVGILTCIAYPSYQSYITRAHRTEGKIALLQLAHDLERYYTEHNTYKDVSLEKIGVKPVTPQGFYKLAILNITDNSYLLQAMPLGAQAKHDTLCKNLSLNELGEKKQTGSGSTQQCWY